MVRITQAMLAKQLGVSQALIARALKDDPAVALETRRRVRAEADRLGYRPNATARALLTGRTGLIGLWIPRPYGSYAARIIFAFEKLAQTAGFDLLIRDLGPLGQSVGDSRRHAGWVDGIIVVDAAWHLDALLRHGRPPAPLVCVGTCTHPAADAVEVDLFAASVAALRHLCAGGARRIAYVHPGHPLGANEARWRAYHREVKTPEVVLVSEPTRAGAYAAALAHLRPGRRPDALFCHNDDYAIGVMRALRELNLRVPDDVGVVGCDGVEDTEYLDCPLTTIRLPYDDMCGQAWSALMERINGFDGPPRRRLLDAEVLPRQSTRAVPH